MFNQYFNKYCDGFPGTHRMSLFSEIDVENFRSDRIRALKLPNGTIIYFSSDASNCLTGKHIIVDGERGKTSIV